MVTESKLLHAPRNKFITCNTLDRAFSMLLLLSTLHHENSGPSINSTLLPYKDSGDGKREVGCEAVGMGRGESCTLLSWDEFLWELQLLLHQGCSCAVPAGGRFPHMDATDGFSKGCGQAQGSCPVRHQRSALSVTLMWPVGSRQQLHK